jgi:hypothetical protein
MSSALAKLSQIPVRSKFLIVLRTLAPGQFDADLAAAFTLDAGKQWGVDVGTVATAASLNAVASPATITLGNLYRDLGRQVMVVNAAGAHVALFREAIRQNSAANEGVMDAPVWLCVWRADGSNVGVARTA